MDLYPFCEDTFMWPSVNGNVLTNRIDIRSEKTHEVTRCKQAHKHIERNQGELKQVLGIIKST